MKTILVVAMIVIIFVLFYMFSQKKDVGTLPPPINCDPRANPGCSGYFDGCSNGYGTYKGVTGCIHECENRVGRGWTTYVCQNGACSDCKVVS